MIYIIVVFIIGLLYIYYRLFSPNKLIVLMYHQIEEESNGDLCVSRKNLEDQLKYLSERKWETLFFRDLNNHHKEKKVIITFDDGYKNNEEYLPPLLKKYNLKATIFIPTRFIEEGYEDYRMMTFAEIKNLDSQRIEIGLHSHSHCNFKEQTLAFLEEDLKKNMEVLEANNITYTKALAYPYGKFPRKKEDKQTFFNMLDRLGITYAVRIGNKINKTPLKSRYELCRVDVKGNDSLLKFKLKLIFGKLKLF